MLHSLCHRRRTEHDLTLTMVAGANNIPLVSCFGGRPFFKCGSGDRLFDEEQLRPVLKAACVSAAGQAGLWSSFYVKGAAIAGLRQVRSVSCSVTWTAADQVSLPKSLCYDEQLKCALGAPVIFYSDSDLAQELCNLKLRFHKKKKIMSPCQSKHTAAFGANSLSFSEDVRFSSVSHFKVCPYLWHRVLCYKLQFILFELCQSNPFTVQPLKGFKREKISCLF